jgi:hypothetical protein
MSFSELYWHPPKLGTVNIEHANKKIVLNNIFSVLGSRLSYRTDGIGVLDINGGLNKEEFVTSEEAYQAYVALMTQLNEQGWRHYWQPWEVRYSRQDNLRLIINQVRNGKTSDTSHILTYEEWQKIFSDTTKTYVNVWADMYLRDIVLHLEIEKLPVNKPNYQQFMVQYQFESVKYTFFTGLNEEQLKLNEQGLRQIYDGYKLTNIKMRKDDEEVAKAQGYHIDETYQDPDMWQYIIEPPY